MELCLAVELTPENKKLIEKESSEIFESYKEFLWYDPQEYRIPLFTWSKVDEDLVPKLSEKISEILFDAEQFELFGSDYVVKIGSRIDVYLRFQREAKFTRLVRALSDAFFGSGIASQEDFAMVAIARYKIPAKQQYSHLKNKLEKLNTDVHLNVKSLSVVKITEFGKGAKEGKVLASVDLPEHI